MEGKGFVPFCVTIPFSRLGCADNGLETMIMSIYSESRYDGIKSEDIGLQSLVIGTQFLVVGTQSLNLILMAGHAGIFRKIDEGRKIAKKTNQKEYEIYSNPGRLWNIIPAVERTSRDNQEVRYG